MAKWKSFKNKAECCYYCLKPTAELRQQGISMTVDHVFPKSKGGANDLENLVTACERCNNMKGESLDWYAGCVASEAFGNPKWFRDILLAEEESRKELKLGRRKNGKERMEDDSEGNGEWKQWTMG